jgi:hypothetical protein
VGGSFNHLADRALCLRHLHLRRVSRLGGRLLSSLLNLSNRLRPVSGRGSRGPGRQIADDLTEPVDF